MDLNGRRMERELIGRLLRARVEKTAECELSTEHALMA